MAKKCTRTNAKKKSTNTSPKTTDETLGKLLDDEQKSKNNERAEQLEEIKKQQKAIKGCYGLWSAVVYPVGETIEEAKSSYEKFLERMKISATCMGNTNVEFILHDKDINLADGTIKKPHIHLMKRFNHRVSIKYMHEWLKSAVGDCITEISLGAYTVVNDPVALDRYFNHSDVPQGTIDPETGKYGYPRSEVVMFGRVIPITYSDFMALVFESNSFKELCMKCKDNEDMAKMLVRHGYFARTYYVSCREDEAQFNVTSKEMMQQISQKATDAILNSALKGENKYTDAAIMASFKKMGFTEEERGE